MKLRDLIHRLLDMDLEASVTLNTPDGDFQVEDVEYEPPPDERISLPGDVVILSGERLP